MIIVISRINILAISITIVILRITLIFVIAIFINVFHLICGNGPIPSKRSNRKSQQN